MLAGTISRNADWHDEKTFWADVAEKSPNTGKSWLGLARANGNDPTKAGEYLRKGLAVDPDNAELHNNYGIVLMATGDPASALAQFQRAMALTQETADHWNNIGGAYYRMGEIGASLKSFQRALQLDPCNFNVRRNLMMLYSQHNEPHAVWQAGEVPAACRMIPDQAAELAELRRRAGRRSP
jgi:Tfp pilus assembly protein PilF